MMQPRPAVQPATLALVLTMLLPAMSSYADPAPASRSPSSATGVNRAPGIVPPGTMPKGLSIPGATMPRTNASPQNPLAAQLFHSLDTNHDNVVTEDEFFGPQEKRFDALDTNHDRQLSLKEFEAGTKFGQPAVQTTTAKASPQNPLAAQLFHRLDTDSDNVVTEDEFFGPHEKRFDALDTNHDRQLSLKESEAGAIFGQPVVQAK